MICTTIQSQQLLIHHGIGYFKLALMDRNMQVRFGLKMVLRILRLGNFRLYNQFLWKAYSALSWTRWKPPSVSFFSTITIFDNGVGNGFFWIVLIPHWSMGKNDGYCNGICTKHMLCWQSRLFYTSKTKGSFHFLLTPSFLHMKTNLKINVQ